MHTIRTSIAALTTAAIALLPVSSFAASFTDVSEKSPQFAAIEYLKARGIMQGYKDGTFRPKQTLTRAEAVKILVSTVMKPEEVQTFTKRSFTDVPEDAWYRPFVEAAFQKLGLIDGPPRSTTFNGEKAIRQAEFLKLLFKSQGIDTTAFGEITLPLADDVTDGSAWFYPLIRFALSSSTLEVSSDGRLHPDMELTRGMLADEIYRLAMYQAGKRTQALLTEEENELVNVLQMLEKKDFTQAERASARALVASRGSLQSKPTVAIVQAAVKIAESFRNLVRAYKAGTDGKLDDVLSLTKDAWTLAEKAQQISPSLHELAIRVQTIAKNMADQARELLKKTP